MIIQYNNIIRQGGKVRNIQDKIRQEKAWGKARQVRGKGKARGKSSQDKGKTRKVKGQGKAMARQVN
jgi:hypothetical protein